METGRLGRCLCERGCVRLHVGGCSTHTASPLSRPRVSDLPSTSHSLQPAGCDWELSAVLKRKDSVSSAFMSPSMSSQNRHISHSHCSCLTEIEGVWHPSPAQSLTSDSRLEEDGRGQNPQTSLFIKACYCGRQQLMTLSREPKCENSRLKLLTVEFDSSHNINLKETQTRIGLTCKIQNCRGHFESFSVCKAGGRSWLA